MFPPTLRPDRRRFILLLGLALALVGGAYGFVGLGRFLAREDPMAHADAIFVLAGSRVERPLEAGDLYLEGYAPLIVLTRATAEPAAAMARQRGVDLPDDLDAATTLLTGLGVPSSALVLPGRVHDNTAQEAETLRAIGVERKWRRVIVVSSKYHLRRAALACRRALDGTGIDVVMRGSRYDAASPASWWRRRSDIRWVASELPKFIGYALGVAG